MASLHVSWDRYNTLVERLALNVYESGYEVATPGGRPLLSHYAAILIVNRRPLR